MIKWIGFAKVKRSEAVALLQFSSKEAAVAWMYDKGVWAKNECRAAMEQDLDEYRFNDQSSRYIGVIQKLRE